MVLYLLKRLVLAIPVLWLIATVIFFLSRLLPGTLNAERILQDNGGFFNSASTAGREAAHRDYLHRTGQDLPVFYFSMKPQVESDTSYRIYPESEKQLLQRLAWSFGDWPAIVAYYKQVKELELAIPANLKPQAQPLLYTLYTSTDSEAILTAINELTSSELNQVHPLLLSDLKVKATSLAENQNRYTFLIPSFTWNGMSNQYHAWLIKTLKGDLGHSMRDGRAVLPVLSQAIGNTILLLLLSMFIASVLALELGILMMRQKYKRLRKLILPALFLTDSIPGFVLALLLLVLFASPAFLQWFPVYGLGYYQADAAWHERLVQVLPYMALPVTCLVLANLPYLTNQFYRSLMNNARADFARTARAKGLSETAIIRRHILRNALLPVITLLSDFLPALVAGTVIIETIFAIPGIGTLLISAVLAQDYPVIIAIILLVAMFKLLAHVLSDILYSVADPRIKLETA